MCDTVDGWNPNQPVEVGSENPIIYRVSAPSQVVVWDWTINCTSWPNQKKQKSSWKTFWFFRVYPTSANCRLLGPKFVPGNFPGCFRSQVKSQLNRKSPEKNLLERHKTLLAKYVSTPGTISCVKIGKNHPIETTIYKQMFQVPGTQLLLEVHLSKIPNLVAMVNSSHHTVAPHVEKIGGGMPHTKMRRNRFLPLQINALYTFFHQKPVDDGRNHVKLLKFWWNTKKLLA